MRIKIIIILLFITSIHSVSGQVLSSSGILQDDGRFAASTKQINQFFRRFNAEESKEGDVRYYPDNVNYRNRELRTSFINILFDNETSDIPVELKKEFLNTVNSESYPQYLNFHTGDWFAEAKTVFSYGGKSQEVTLFLKLQPEGLGYEWVIENVNFEPFRIAFDKPKGDQKKFLHPLSHELGFMNLRRAIQDDPKPESYTPTDFDPDYLTLFIFEIKKGNLKFETVKEVKYHFFQIQKWYFELSQFNRPGFNTGWLISNLVKLGEGDRDVIIDYIYDRK